MEHLDATLKKLFELSILTFGLHALYAWPASTHVKTHRNRSQLMTLTGAVREYGCAVPSPAHRHSKHPRPVKVPSCGCEEACAPGKACSNH